MCYVLIVNKMIKKMPEQKFRHTNQNKCAINQILFKNDSIILSLALFIDLLN